MKKKNVTSTILIVQMYGFFDCNKTWIYKALIDSSLKKIIGRTFFKKRSQHLKRIVKPLKSNLNALFFEYVNYT